MRQVGAETPQKRRWVRRAILPAIGLAMIGGTLFGLERAGARAFVTEEAGRVGASLVDALGLRVQNVTLAGRQNADAASIAEALGVKRGDDILAFSVADARERIERVDWVGAASVRRLLPDRIHIQIVEKEPFALWQRGGVVSVIDRTGAPITDENVESHAALPLVVGHGAAGEARDIIQLVRAEPDIFSRVRAYVRVGDRRWNLRLENGVDVRLPERDMGVALAELAVLDQEQKLLSRDIKSVDLRLRDRISIEMTPAAQEKRALSKRPADPVRFEGSAALGASDNGDAI